MYIDSHPNKAFNSGDFCQRSVYPHYVQPAISVSHLVSQERQFVRLNTSVEQPLGHTPSLNYVSARIGSQHPVFVPHFTTNVNHQERFLERGEAQDRFHLNRRPQLVHMPNGHFQQMHQKVSLIGPQNEKYLQHIKSQSRFNQNIGLRKRNISDTTNETYDSHPSKFQKISEDANSARRRCVQPKLMAEARSRHQQSSNSPPFDKKESYAMNRLDLGPSIGRKEKQTQLKSRLKAMAYSEKVLTASRAIVVPSLPSILSSSTP
jgi:hypothetical protein